MGYFIDSLFRRNANPAPVTTGAVADDGSALPTGSAEPEGRAHMLEVARIFMQAIHTGPLPAQDVDYVGRLVAQRIGLTQQVAEKRVADTYAVAQAKLKNIQSAAMGFCLRRVAAIHLAARGRVLCQLGATFGGRRRDL
ncbi:MAG: hypothetical protein ABI040_08065 [Rhodoferax sp.]